MKSTLIIIDGRKNKHQQYIYTDIFIDGKKINTVQEINFNLAVDCRTVLRITTFEHIDEDLNCPIYKDNFYEDFRIVTVNNWKEYLEALK